MRARGLDFASKVVGDGTGPALLWGHSLMGSMRQEEEAAMMPWIGSSASAPLVRWDARGHGASEATLIDEDYRWSELAADLWALADELDIERAVIGGVSMGAGTALHAAVSAPERTLGLVLMAPPTAWATRPRQSRIYRTTAKMIERIGLGPLRVMGGLAAHFARNDALGRLQRSVMHGLRTAEPRAVQCALRGAALSDLPPVESLEQLEVPTLILAWKHDASHPLSTAEALAERMPIARLEVAGETSEIEDWPGLVRAFMTSLRIDGRADEHTDDPQRKNGLGA